MSVAKRFRKHLLAIAIGASGVMLPSMSQATCSCVQNIPQGAGEIAGVVGEGSASVVEAITEGFEDTGSTVEQAIGEQTSDLEGFLTAMTKTLVSEIDQIPAEMQKMENELQRLHPAKHASDTCGYVSSTDDQKIAERLTSLQEDNLNAASNGYNKMTSSYPSGVDATDRFLIQTARMLRDDPAMKTVGMRWLKRSDEFGALPPDDIQRAATFINVTTNPNPPQIRDDAGSVGALKNNVEGELYNMRMTIAQAVQNQLLSYRTPAVKDGGGVDGEDSWLTRRLKRLSPEMAEAVRNGEVSVSKEDLLKLMATHRVQDASWVGDVSGKDPEGVIKDLALLKADSMKMDYEIWLQERNTALLMSQLLATQIRAARGGN
ncbi:MAG: Uncharacterized protein AWU57_6 [Marinobacter sp. T13-3]|nr:MAG: Uncharacterized protein AWU57_6 [Marinobacter sp. T13-3]